MTFLYVNSYSFFYYYNMFIEYIFQMINIFIILLKKFFIDCKNFDGSKSNVKSIL